MTTFGHLAGAKLPTDRYFDGRDISQVLLSDGDESNEQRILFFYFQLTLVAVRFGAYKVHFFDLPFPSNEELRANCHGLFPLNNWMSGETVSPVKFSSPVIYNVEVDPGESLPLPASEHAPLLAEIYELIAEHNKTLLDLPDPVLSIEYRSKTLVPCCNYPYCTC